MRTAIVTMNIGKVDCIDLTQPYMEKYAKFTGSDFHSITTKKYKLGNKFYHIVWEKCQLYDYLGVYDRILFIDADVLILPRAPNIFCAYPADRYCGVNDFYRKYMQLDIKRLNRLYNTDYNLTGRYFNGGVLMCSKEHRDIFKLPSRQMTNHYLHFSEQSYWSYKAVDMKFNMLDMGYQWNTLKPHERRHPLEYYVKNSYFIHFTCTHICGRHQTIEKAIKLI